MQLIFRQIQKKSVAQEAFDKMSNEGVETARACTKIRFGGFRGILRRFAKYTLLRMDDECYPSERIGVLHFSMTDV